MKSLIPTYYKLTHYLHSLIFLVGMLALLGLIGWLVAGPSGLVWFSFAGIFLIVGTLKISPEVILHLHRAQFLHPDDNPTLYKIIMTLAQRAGIKKVPALYYLPTRKINAFSTGTKNRAYIAVSDGMLQSLTLRELTGVLAHETSHIHSNDIIVMLIANVIGRLTNIMAFAGTLLIAIYVPLYLFTETQAPWLLMFILMISPTLSALMQLALSRSREFSADLEAAMLCGDSLGLASALEKIDRYQGNWIARQFSSHQYMREPILLRTHPLVGDRVNRLKSLAYDFDPDDQIFQFSDNHVRSRPHSSRLRKPWLR